MQVYRNQNRIIADVLAAVRDCRAEGREATISLVMRKSNLSHPRITKVLGQLMGTGLIQRTEDRHYTLSERGLQYLRLYSEFDEFAISYGLRI